MSDNLQNLLRESLLNNSYDYKSMHLALRKTWENSYSYLYELQRSCIEYEEIHYDSNNEESYKDSKIGHLYIDLFSAYFDVDYDFIHIKDREEFYHSEFYKKEFTIKDMVSHPEIFSKLPIIMIDNQTIWDYTIILRNGHFSVKLPFNRLFVISRERNSDGSLIYLDHKIQIMVVDNIYYKRIITNTSNIHVNHDKKTITLSRMTVPEIPDSKDGLYFVSLHFPNDVGKDYELGSTIIPFIQNSTNSIGNISQGLIDKIDENIENVNKVYISVIFVNNIKRHITYKDTAFTECDSSNKCILSVIQKDESTPYAMPIPVENLLVIRKSVATGEYMLVQNTKVIKLHYPNIYEIVDEDREIGDRYYIFYFYDEARTLEYSPIFDFFNRFLRIRFDNKPIEQIYTEIYRGLIDTSSFSSEQFNQFTDHFNKILNYQYYNYKYGDVDFCKRYRLESENLDKTENEYKDETLKNWINEDSMALKNYVIEQNKLYESVYHLWVSLINLSSRIRTNTNNEIGQNIDLGGQYYVFAFRDENSTSSKLLDARLYVDGMCISDVKQYRYLYTDFFYVPVDRVTSDSYIEIEVFPSYEHVTPLKFTEVGEEKEFTLLEPSDRVFPTAQDVYLMTPTKSLETSQTETSDTKCRDTRYESYSVSVDFPDDFSLDMVNRYKTDSELFKIIAEYKEGNFDVVTTDIDKPVNFTRLSKFKIQALDSELVGKNLWFRIAKIPHNIEFIVDRDGYPFIEIRERNFNFDLEYMRIFKNGRLIPKEKYYYKYSFYYPRIYFLDETKAGDAIYIDIAPYRYKEIYYQEEIEHGDSPIINLKDVITKPFDIRYYDVYMNGRKLSMNNVFSVSPWEITLVNLKSFYNLQIFEKERDWEYFGTNYKEREYYYTLDDLLNSDYIEESEKDELIKQIINESKDPNLNIDDSTNDEEKQDHTDYRKWLMTYIFYFSELLPKTYVNPVRMQFNKLFIKEDFEEIGNNYIIGPNKENQPSVLYLNPNVYIEGRKHAGTQRVFCVGHPSTVKETFLNSPPSIIFQPDIDGED